MRRLIASALIAAVAGGAALAEEVGYPSRPITVIVPAPHGGGTDLFARALAGMVEVSLGQKVQIDNKAGGGGTLGVTHLIASRPDGYTISFAWNGPLTAMPHHLAVPYALEQFRTVLSVAYSSYVLCAPKAFPASNAKALIAHLRSNTGKLTYGNDGGGGTMHLAAERIFQQIGVRVRGIPHSGASDTAQALLTGQIDLYGGSLPPILPHVQAGKVKCLLLTSAGGNPAVPEAVGLEALDLAREETVLWWGVLAPANTPIGVVQKLEQAFKEAAMTEQFEALLAKQGATRRILGGEETAAMLREEFAALGRISRTVALQRR